ncbi:chlorophyll a/b-binding protein domain-containing protein, partial [Ochromonadaceae sp. CCMP2298]
AAAFAPAGRVATSALKMGFESELGVLPPVGFFDPLGFCNDCDQETFDRRRTVELKHGRVAMLAVTGYIVQEVFRFPADLVVDGTLKFADVPNGIAALSVVPLFGWTQIFLSIGYWELKGWKQASDIPGDFGTGYFGKSLQGEEKAEKLTKELQNGRLAMLGIMELLHHD